MALKLSAQTDLNYGLPELLAYLQYKKQIHASDFMFSWLRLLSSNWVSASSFLLQCGACVQDLMYSHVAGEVYLLSYGKSSSDMKGAHTFFKERGKQSIDCLCICTILLIVLWPCLKATVRKQQHQQPRLIFVQSVLLKCVVLKAKYAAYNCIQYMQLGPIQPMAVFTTLSIQFLGIISV